MRFLKGRLIDLHTLFRTVSASNNCDKINYNVVHCNINFVVNFITIYTIRRQKLEKFAEITLQTNYNFCNHKLQQTLSRLFCFLDLFTSTVLQLCKKNWKILKSEQTWWNNPEHTRAVVHRCASDSVICTRVSSNSCTSARVQVTNWMNLENVACNWTTRVAQRKRV